MYLLNVRAQQEGMDAELDPWWTCSCSLLFIISPEKRRGRKKWKVGRAFCRSEGGIFIIWL